MEKLPVELNIYIYEYLDLKYLRVYNKKSLKLMRSNETWKYRVEKRFKVKESKNFYEEYKWQLKLKLKKEAYQRQFTLGCVGKIYALEKPEWKQALKIY